MKNLLRVVRFTTRVAAIAAGLSLASCQKEPSVTPSSEDLLSTQQESIITFQGLKVRKPSGVPREMFDFATGKDVREFFDRKYYANSNGRLSANKIPAGIFYATLEKIVNKYPSELGMPPYKKEDLKQIHKDFPDLKKDNEEEIQKNVAIIVEYYSRLISNEFEPALAELSASNSGGRLEIPIENGAGNQWEQAVTRDFPQAGLSVYNAALDARNWATEQFGLPGYGDAGNLDNWRGNAFKHAAWNAQGVRKMVNGGYERFRAFYIMKLFATAHEKDPNVNVILTAESNMMDFHNNAQGRTYMKNNIGWGIFGLRSIPGEGNIRNDLGNACANACFIGSGQSILNLTYGNISAIADADYVDYQGYAALQYNPTP
ncbi:DUF6973 domain-containing protein [Spirosoma utsteinense]|uniref:DUF6973 domain-containing protein n=1 Tax=Spirosoma utsteinense TaxID=2585773 RepID=A0ABR6WG29_9BACT|nr:hypothetical protein [Spirosoma utsteinense]MBC3795274.1 hypothetical protein [Spirosoma utsteinense]